MSDADIRAASLAVQKCVWRLDEVQAYFMLGTSDQAADGLFAMLEEEQGRRKPAECVSRLIDSLKEANRLLPPHVEPFRAACADVAQVEDLSEASSHELAMKLCAKYATKVVALTAMAARMRDCKDGWIPKAIELVPTHWQKVRSGLAELPIREIDRDLIVSYLQVELAKAQGSTAESGGRSDSFEQTKTTVNSRMLDTVQKTPESVGWTVTQWEAHLGCSRGAIAKAPAWQSLKVVKAEQQLSKAKPKDRHRKK
jgi:hypothetical protein